MRALLRSAVVCAPLLGLLPSLAAAQTQAIDVNLVVKRNGKTVENGTAVYADIADCGGDPVKDDDEGSTFTFSTTYPNNPAAVELWLGVDQDCSQPTTRVNQATTNQPPLCKKLGVDTSGARTPVLTVKGRALFQRLAPTDGSKPTCDTVHGATKYTVYLLPLGAAGTATDAKAVVPNGTISTLKAIFSPYTKRPEPPTSISGVNGENRLEVSFKAPSSSVALTKYRAYFDTNKGGGSTTPTTDAGNGTTDAGDAPVADAGGNVTTDAGATDAAASGGGDAGGDGDAGSTPVADAGASDAATASDAGSDGGTSSDAGAESDAGTGATAACGSGQLVGKKVAPVNAAGIVRTGASDSKKATLTDLSNVEIDQTVAVAVVAIDPAGNESFLSDPICVTRKQTDGFRDACRANNEGDCGLQSCSVDPTNRGSTLSIALLALAMTALIRRRGRA